MCHFGEICVYISMICVYLCYLDCAVGYRWVQATYASVAFSLLQTRLQPRSICGKKNTTNAYREYEFIVCYLLQTFLQTSSVVISLLQTRVLYMRWHYVSSHRCVYKHRLQQDFYYRHVYYTHVDTIFFHTDAFINIVCRRI